jgi:hypothetical protein
MALVKCKECGSEVSSKAEACPKCGAKVAPKSVGCVTSFLVIGGVLWFIGWIASSNSPSVSPSSSVRAPEVAAPVEVRPTWEYLREKDDMSSGEIRHAAIRSLNFIEFDFPYQGPQRATLRLRDHPRWGKNVIFQIERGQLLCRTDDCTVRVRFDDGSAQTFSASEPDDHSSETLFIQNYARFLKRLRGAKVVRIQPTVYQQGSPTFEFDVSGLQW